MNNAIKVSLELDLIAEYEEVVDTDCWPEEDPADEAEDREVQYRFTRFSLANTRGLNFSRRSPVWPHSDHEPLENYIRARPWFRELQDAMQHVARVGEDVSSHWQAIGKLSSIIDDFRYLDTLQDDLAIEIAAKDRKWKDKIALQQDR